jgi:two-component system cell cycle sensor histidine kinase/response regulator CckA
MGVCFWAAAANEHRGTRVMTPNGRKAIMVLGQLRRKHLVYLSLCIVVYIAAVVAFTVRSGFRARAEIMGDIDRRLTLAAKSLKYILAPDFHDRAVDADSISPEEETRNRIAVSEFAFETEFEYLYTLVEKDGRFFFSAPTVTAEELKARTSWYFYPYDDIPDAFVRAYRTHIPAFVEYTDQWGTFRSIALPQRTEGGRTYLACADYNISAIQRILTQNTYRSVLTAVYFLLFSLPFVLLIQRVYSAYNAQLMTVNSELTDVRLHLEDLVRDRTLELQRTNENLRSEINERRQAEQALQRSEARLRAIFEATPDPLVVYDNQGRVQYLNPAFTRVFDWRLEDLRDKRIPFVPDDRTQSTASMIAELYATGKPIRMETRRLTRDGRTLDVFIGAADIKGDGTDTAGMVVSLTDLTDRKKLEYQFHTAQRLEALGTLAGGIAHDFNNLLMGIQGRTSLMLLDGESGGGHTEHLLEIEAYVKKSAELTRQLLGFARGGKYDVKPVDLNRLVRQSAEMFARTHRDITVELRCQSDISVVDADRGQIEQVLLNLYLNAVQAMPGGGRIQIETARVSLDAAAVQSHELEPGPYVKLSVSDTGSGIAEDTLHHIFEPFFTTKTHGRSSGLGLASAYGIIKNHGGFITVDSRRGEGAAFHIFLPASDKEIAADVSAPQKLVTGSGTILLVDDEAMILDVGAQMLRRLGYSVLTAAGGRDALAVYRRQHEAIDLVILDMIMPDMDGNQTYEALTAIDPGVCVMLATGFSINEKAESMLKCGCRGFIQKPFDINALSQKIHEVIGTA